jgi:CheY-like chemotaxis protein
LIVTAQGASAGGVAQLLSAISQLLWPVVALVLAYWLLPELKQIFRRVSESKNMKVKWGDKELSIQEAADNIQKVVGSLMDAEVPRAPTLSSAPPTAPVPPPAAAAPGAPRPEAVVPPESQLAAARLAAFSLRRVLWVDDKPNHVALEIARLKDWGVRIDEARSTEDALELFEPHKYSLVITDMVRSEGTRTAVAGINLLKELKTIDPTVVVIAYCGASSARQYGAAFLRYGGTSVTSSPVELFEQLNQYLARD